MRHNLERCTVNQNGTQAKSLNSRKGPNLEQNYKVLYLLLTFNYAQKMQIEKHPTIFLAKILRLEFRKKICEFFIDWNCEPVFLPPIPSCCNDGNSGVWLGSCQNSCGRVWYDSCRVQQGSCHHSLRSSWGYSDLSSFHRCFGYLKVASC